MAEAFNLDRLKDPFQPQEVEWRLAQCGKSSQGIWAQCLAYISARAIMDRLDAVVGPQNWKAEYSLNTQGIMCSLSIRINNEWVSKSDGSGYTDFEAFKGGISGALKRAGAVWGVGRYLYSLEATYAKIVPKNTSGSHYSKTKDGEVFYWIPPSLPQWALPKNYSSVHIDNVVVHRTPSNSDEQNLQSESSQVPAANSTLVQTAQNLGFSQVDEYRIDFGKHKGKTLNELGLQEAVKYASWLKSDAEKQGKPLGRSAQLFISKVNESSQAPSFVNESEEIPF